MSTKPQKPTPLPRGSTRFKPDPEAVAQLNFVTPTPSKDNASPRLGLILNESRGGCAIIFVTDSPPTEGQPLLIQLGSAPITKAEVRWCIQIDKEVFKFGVKYL